MYIHRKLQVYETCDKEEMKTNWIFYHTILCMLC